MVISCACFFVVAQFGAFLLVTVALRDKILQECQLNNSFNNNNLYPLSLTNLYFLQPLTNVFFFFIFRCPFQRA